MVTLTLSVYCLFFFLMIRRPPRSTLDRSAAASDVYKRQVLSNAAQAAAQWRFEYKEDFCIQGQKYLFQNAFREILKNADKYACNNKIIDLIVGFTFRLKENYTIIKMCYIIHTFMGLKFWLSEYHNRHIGNIVNEIYVFSNCVLCDYCDYSFPLSYKSPLQIPHFSE